MKLTPSEKLIALMLCDLHKKLEIANGSIDAAFVQEAIISGNTWGLTWEYDVLLSEDVATTDVNWVVDVLDMWRLIEEAYSRYTDAEKAAISESVGAHQFQSFGGFDHNNEYELASILSFLVKKLRRFDSFGERADLNSHAPHRAIYDRMLQVYAPMRSTLVDRRALSTEQMIQIQRAGRHRE